MLQLVELTGSPQAMGRIHGEALRDPIAENLDLYFERFERDGALSRTAVLERAAAYWPAVQAADQAYATALSAIAASANQDLLAVVALNVRYEILYSQYGTLASDGCTAFAALPDATVEGHLLMGENWDWIPGVQGAMLRSRYEDGLDVLSFTEAGIVGGKIGLNSVGVGLAVNGLISRVDDWGRLGRPFHMLCDGILRSRSREVAVDLVARSSRSCSGNFLIGDRTSGVENVETAPDATFNCWLSEGIVVHTNHFVDPVAVAANQVPNPRLTGSACRMERMRTLLASGLPLSAESICVMLADHDEYPDSVCRHPNELEPEGERLRTVTSVVMDLHAGSIRITDGSPCEVDHDLFVL